LFASNAGFSAQIEVLDPLADRCAKVARVLLRIYCGLARRPPKVVRVVLAVYEHR
jgi:hypothetical protein